jgi:hypothetical protein
VKSIRRLKEEFWPVDREGRSEVYAVLDGARDEQVYAFVQACYLDKWCLYAGELPKELLITAPWLVRLDEDNNWTHRIISHAWSNSWGVFIRTETSAKELRTHLRRFLRVRDTSGRNLIFRYYDPRVLRVYLPTCTPAELKMFYGPIDRFYIEDHDASILDFSLEKGALRQARIELAEVGRPV